jgi:hypothetical protein
MISIPTRNSELLAIASPRIRSVQPVIEATFPYCSLFDPAPIGELQFRRRMQIEAKDQFRKALL